MRPSAHWSAHPHITFALFVLVVLATATHASPEDFEVAHRTGRRWPDLVVKGLGVRETGRGDVARRCGRSRAVSSGANRSRLPHAARPNLLSRSLRAATSAAAPHPRIQPTASPDRSKSSASRERTGGATDWHPAPQPGRNSSPIATRVLSMSCLPPTSCRIGVTDMTNTKRFINRLVWFRG